MKTQDEQRIGNLLEAFVATLRARTNQGMTAVGQGISSFSASLVSLVVCAFLFFNLFLFLNIALGFYLGTLSGSPALGFLMLAGIYLLLLAVYWLVHKRIERRVHNRMARRALHLCDNVNARLDTIPALRVDEAYRERYISGEPNPYYALELRKQEAAYQAYHAARELDKEVKYVRHNYGDMVRNAVQRYIVERYPAARYLSRLLDMFSSPSSGRTRKTDSEYYNTGGGGMHPTKQTRLERWIDNVQPYVPYINMAYNVVRPIATALLISKTQGWLLSLIGLRKKR